MNALSDPRASDYLNENFVATYLKVGTFAIVNGNKVGGNVASYFCLTDGTVIHAVPGQVSPDKLMEEARWAYETRKAARTRSINPTTGLVDFRRYSEHMRTAHVERYHAEKDGRGQVNPRQKLAIPASMPRAGTQAQAHWLLASQPMAKLDDVYPIVWTQILREQLSNLPVARR